jgi:hypothetical protein
MSTPHPPFWRTPLGWACIGFAAIAALFLATGHAAHVLSVLAWLALLACPLMHVLMHRHGRQIHDRGKAEKADAPRND